MYDWDCIKNSFQLALSSPCLSKQSLGSPQCSLLLRKSLQQRPKLWAVDSAYVLARRMSFARNDHLIRNGGTILCGAFGMGYKRLHMWIHFMKNLCEFATAVLDADNSMVYGPSECFPVISSPCNEYTQKGSKCKCSTVVVLMPPSSGKWNCDRS